VGRTDIHNKRRLDRQDNINVKKGSQKRDEGKGQSAKNHAGNDSDSEENKVYSELGSGGCTRAKISAVIFAGDFGELAQDGLAGNPSSLLQRVIDLNITRSIGWEEGSYLTEGVHGSPEFPPTCVMGRYGSYVW
jgi:hypothetical protein